MATAANIAVSVTARTGKFQKGMRRAQRTVKRFASSVAGMAKRLAKFGAVLGGVAVAGLVLLTRQAFKTIDTISKLSDSIGIATEDIIGLQHAAEITGVGTEAMNKALEKMVKNIGEAQTGFGTAIRTFEQLGLSADDLAKAGGAEAFKRIAEEINKLPDAAAKANAAYQIWGRQGVKLINTTALGRSGLEAMAAEAKKLGLAFDRDAGAKVEAFNDAWTRTKELFIGASRVIAVSLAPALTELTNRFIAFANWGPGVAQRVSNAFRFIVGAVGTAIEQFAKLRSEMTLLPVAMKQAIADFQTGRSFTGAMGRNQRLIVKLMTGITVPTFGLGLGLALQEEIDKGLAKSAKIMEEFGKKSGKDIALAWFDEMNKKFGAPLASVVGGAFGIDGMGARAGRPGLRTVSELGGGAGLRAVLANQAGRAQNQLLVVAKSSNLILRQIQQQQLRGGTLNP